MKEIRITFKGLPLAYEVDEVVYIKATQDTTEIVLVIDKVELLHKTLLALDKVVTETPKERPYVECLGELVDTFDYKGRTFPLYDFKEWSNEPKTYNIPEYQITQKTDCND